MLSMACGANSCANALLSKLMVAFPDVNASLVRMISTIPSVGTTVISLLIGPFLGKKIGYRKVLISGAILYTLAGFAPAIFNSTFTSVLVCRIVYGIGLGLLVCRSGYLMLMVTPSTKGTAQANMTTIFNASAVLLGLLAGYLGDIRWQLGFLPYLIGIIPVVFMLINLKEPEMQSTGTSQQKEHSGGNDEKIARRTILYIGFLILAVICGYTWMTAMSGLLTERGSDSSTKVSVILSACQLGGVFGTILYAKLTA